MSKKVEDLAWIYLNAFAEEGGHDIYAISKPDQRTVEGVKAIVRALRDDMRITVLEGTNVTEQCCGAGMQAEGATCCERPYYVVPIDDVLKLFDEILGAAGSEKVAGGPTREDGRAEGVLVASSGCTPEALVTPATAPAPAVCVWTQTAVAYWRAGCHASAGPMYAIESEKRVQKCTLCQRPIKFTEAK